MGGESPWPGIGSPAGICRPHLRVKCLVRGFLHPLPPQLTQVGPSWEPLAMSPSPGLDVGVGKNLHGLLPTHARQILVGGLVPGQGIPLLLLSWAPARSQGRFPWLCP